MAKATSWCFTINNPLAKDIPTFWPGVKDAVWQLEQGDSGTPHLQGFVRFSGQKRLAGVKKLDATAHWEPARDPAASVAYCTKEDSRVDGPWTIGDPSITQGKRCDIADAMSSLRDGQPLLDVLEANPKLLRIKRHLAEYASERSTADQFELRQKKKVGAVLRPWQLEVMEFLDRDPGDRAILWVYCDAGNSGKTWLADYLGLFHKAFVLNPSKKADIAYAFKSEPIVVFDCSRCIYEGVLDTAYGVAEEFKNGRMFSTKYESQVKVFAPPHVIFFANVPPDGSKWSQDRYAVYKIENGTLVTSDARTEKENKTTWNN